MKKIIAALILLAGCKASDKIAKLKPDFSTAPSVLVYKTKANYYQLVPVLLSEDKSKIVSFPSQDEIKNQSGYTLPVSLRNGYLIDNKGIAQNVAFLKLTYDEYANLQTLPSSDELYKMIFDKDPLTELCNCGNKSAFKNLGGQLNRMIEEDKIRSICKTVK